MAEYILSQDDDSRQLNVRSGDHIIINLKENPTTGASWEPMSSDQAVAVVSRRDFSLSGLNIGSAGNRQLEFEAAKPGTTEIGAKLRRPWDPSEKYYDLVKINVNVSAA